MYKDDEKPESRKAHQEQGKGPVLGLAVLLKLIGESRITERFEFALPDKLSETTTPYAVEVAWARTAQGLVEFGIPPCESVRQIASSLDGSGHEGEGPDEPSERDDSYRLLRIHTAQTVRASAASACWNVLGRAKISPEEDLVDPVRIDAFQAAAVFEAHVSVPILR